MNLIIINTVDRLERWTGGLLAYLLPVKPQLALVSFDSILAGAMLPLTQKIRDKNISLTKHILPPNIAQNQKKNANTVNTGSGKQSIVDRLVNINMPRK